MIWLDTRDVDNRMNAHRAGEMEFDSIRPDQLHLKSEQTMGGKGHVRHKADTYFSSLGSLGSVVTRHVVHVYFLF